MLLPLKQRGSACFPITNIGMQGSHLFMNHGERISVTVTDKHRNKDIGLEIPTTYIFQHMML